MSPAQGHRLKSASKKKDDERYIAKHVALPVQDEVIVSELRLCHSLPALFHDGDVPTCLQTRRRNPSRAGGLGMYQEILRDHRVENHNVRVLF